MRVPLNFSKGLDRISVACSVRSAVYSSMPIPITFVLDTGSPKTFIDRVSASRARIAIRNLNQDSQSLMGGNKVGLYMLGNVTVNFRTADDKLYPVQFGAMNVAEDLRTGKKSIISPISILGLDFLVETKASLFIKPYSKEAYLDFG